MQIINFYSALWFGAFLLAIAAFILFRRKASLPRILIFSVLLVGLATAWLVLHPRQSATYTSADQVQAAIGSGTAVLLEFQSPY
jgi:hypothetical protein